MKKILTIILSMLIAIGTAMSSVGIAYAADDTDSMTTNKSAMNSITNSIAYAVYDPDNKELDFIRSKEKYKNKSTGTVKSISGGSYTGTIYTGFEENTQSSSDTVPWYSIRSQVKTVKFIDTIKPKDTTCWFGFFENCTSIDLKRLDTSNVTKMSSMFDHCMSLSSLDLSSFDTSNVTNFDYMFEFCVDLQSLNISNFDTSKAQGMAGMFSDCKSLISLDLSNFDTSNVTSMRFMFGYDETLKSLDISGFDTSNTTDMYGMFISCPKLSLLKLGNKFKISSKDYKEMISTPEETISGRASSGKWGLDSETADTTYSSDELVEKGKTAGTLAGNWYAQFSGSAAYAVFNPDTGEMDFIRSEENHDNGETGTVKSISGGTYNGTIYSGFEEEHYGYYPIRPVLGCAPWLDIAKNIKTIKTIDPIKPNSISCWFYKMINCTSMDLKKLDTSNVTGMGSLFYGCSNLETLDISNWNTSNVTSMNYMFKDCSKLRSLNVSSFDTSNVTNMSGMFWGCDALTSLDLSTFDTSKVTSMDYLFYNCHSLQNLDVSNFDTSNVTDMHYMFSNCSKLSSLDLSRFDTSKVANMAHMFEDCTSLNKITFSKNFKCLSNVNFPTPNTSTDSGKKVIGQWGLNSETANKTYTADELTTYGTEKIGNLAGTWYAQADVSNAYAVFNSDTGELDFIRSNETHKNNTTGTIKSISGESYTGTIFTDFENNTKSQKAPWTAYADKVKKVKFLNSIAPKNMANWFKGMSNCTEIALWDLDSSETTDMSFLFSGCKALQSLDFYDADTSKVTNMDHMFQDCQSLTKIYTKCFDTSNVTNMNAMFSNCKSLESLDVSKFNTSKVRDMRYMFNNCSKLSSLDVSNFNTSNTSIMTAMFNNCSNLKSLDVSRFDTSNVKYMNSMFYNDQKLSFLDLNSFDTSKVKEMNYMLYHSGISEISFGEKFKVADAHTNIFSDPFKTISKKASSGKWGINSEKADTVYSANELASQASLNGTWYAQLDNSTAYAVFNPNSGELDLIRSKETHANNTTGTIKSTSGKSYTGTIFTGFEENKKSQKAPWSAYASNIKYVNFVDAIQPSSTDSWFKGMSICDSIDLAKLDTSNTTDMGAMFYDCSSLQNIDLKNINTSKATNMSGMFENCSALQSINVKSFDTSKVTDMSDMFDGCYSLQSLDVTNFDTSNVTNMSLMFNYCYALQSLDLSSFNTTKVKKMTYMFNMCQNLNKITFGKNFKVASSHSAMFATPYTTASGRDSTGQWGLDSESASKTYSSYSLASYGTRTGALAGTWYAQADSSIVTYTDSISHWANGFKNKEGNNNDKSSFLLGKTSFSQEAASKYSLDSSKATTIPNGFKLSNGFDSASIDGLRFWYIHYSEK